jgi:hypothetical protein
MRMESAGFTADATSDKEDDCNREKAEDMPATVLAALY